MNAKELILSKINATAKFVDIYTYLLSLDVPFLDIASFMQSPIFNKIIYYTQPNIFDASTSKYNLKNALGFYLNKEVLNSVNKQALKLFLSDHYVKLYDKISKELNNNEEQIQLWFQQNAYNIDGIFITDLDAIINDAWDKYNSSKHVNYDETLDQMDLMDEIDDEIENVPTSITSNDYFTIARFLEEFKLKTEFMNNYKERELIAFSKDFHSLETIYNDIIPAMEEMEILGAMLGINQGMRTDDYKMYSYVKRIENFINSKYNNASNKDETLIPFNLMYFLQNEDYRLNQIKQYNQVKTSYNILDIITSVPHFASMFKLLHLNNYSLNMFSAAYALEREIAETISPKYKKQQIKTSKLNEKEFKEVQKYINDLFILNWLKDSNFTLKLPEGCKYFNGSTTDMEIVPLGQVREITLNSIYDIASFKYNMDNYIIPMLKADPNLRDNQFIQNLNKTVIEDKNKKIVFYRLPLNMMQIEASQNTISLYEDILNDFDLISQNTFLDWKIGDLFYLYNLIVNKDAFGQNSMTRIFENLIHSKNKLLLVNDFNQKISEWDNDLDARNTISYNINDIILRISERVTNTKIQPEDVDVSIDGFNPSYFTFNMPYWSSEITQKVIKNVAPFDPKYKDASKFSPESAIISIANRLMKNSIPIHLINSMDLKELAVNDSSLNNESVHAFIKNGEIYVIVDRAKPTDLIHEYVHLILATMKFGNDTSKQELYYQLMESIKSHPKFNKYAALYPNSHGSDLQEEVLCKVLQSYLQNLTDSSTLELSKFSEDFLEAIETLFNDENQELRNNVANRIFKGMSEDDMYDVNDDILVSLGMSTFIDVVNDINHKLLLNSNYSEMYDKNLILLSQKVATLKDKFINNSQLEQECN